MCPAPYSQRGLYAVPAHPEPGELLGPSDQPLPLGSLLRPSAKLYRLGAHALTSADFFSPTTEESSEVPAPVRAYMTILPSLRERTRPRERSARRPRLDFADL